MEGKRKIASVLEQRIRDLGPGEEVPLTGNYQKLASKVKTHAQELIHATGAKENAVIDTLNEALQIVDSANGESELLRASASSPNSSLSTEYIEPFGQRSS